MNNHLIETASHWLNRGIAVIPVHYRQKTPAIKSWRRYQSELPTSKDLVRWFAHGWRNLAIVTGWQNLTVIDFDDLYQYQKWFSWALDNGGDAARAAQYSFCVASARGIHVYVFCRSHNGKFNGGDIKAAGGYVLGPPSVHPSGVTYEVLDPQADIVTVASVEAILPDPPQQPASIDTEPQTITPWDKAASCITGEMGMIDRIKEEHNILDYFPDAVQSDLSGRWYKTQCPFHQDVNPSFWIDTKKQLCGCYSCQFKPMDIINLIARLNGVSNREAVGMIGG